MRCADDLVLVDVPLYIQVHEIQPNGLAVMEEKLINTVSEIIAKHNGSKTIEKIENLKKGVENEKDV